MCRCSKGRRIGGRYVPFSTSRYHFMRTPSQTHDALARVRTRQHQWHNGGVLSWNRSTRLRTLTERSASELHGRTSKLPSESRRPPVGLVSTTHRRSGGQRFPDASRRTPTKVTDSQSTSARTDSATGERPGLDPNSTRYASAALVIFSITVLI